MADVAQRITLGPFFVTGSLLASAKLYHYLAGTSTLKNAWSDRAMGSTVAQPFVSDANGVFSFFADGLYKFRLDDSADTTIFTWDNYDVTTSVHYLDGSLVFDPGSLVDGAGETSSAITVTGAALGDYVLVSAPYDLQGITATAYVSATDTVKIRLQNETTGTIDLASGTWKVRVIEA